METLSILVLEDHPFQAQVVAQQLRTLGCRNLFCAADGEAALVRLSSHGPVDIALCDINLPGMDGLTFLRKAAECGAIRSVALFSGLAPDLRLAALQLARLLGLQVLGDLGKVLSPDSLRNVLLRYRRGAPAAGAQSDDAQPTAQEARLALIQGQLVPYYQPKVDLRSLQPAGAEVLVRWQHPRLGLLGPAGLLPLLEELGLVRDLTEYLLKAAMAFLQWQQPESRLPLAINCPPYLLEEPDLPGRLQELLDYYRLPSSLINVEITENGLPGIAANSLENLLRLRLMGCGIAIDDFGTGTSSLQRLCQLPCNELKLDASFIHGMEQNPRVLAAVTSSLALAASLGMNAVAEGIESTRQLEQLRELGCAQGQGYLFGHPMPGREFANWLRRWPGSTLPKEA
ncbi:EAL domain-containing response regulator [Pseudomonas sp. BN102]|uniref:EAL domain-containing response regulator n=1 Tax=Pseudomonas sp. BN102 TaxID=2567886 RepID=UPI0024547DC0|nr:EAL domain-containing response regulator [Pseudomonas sp. BN102]MDH4610710.1 EAL domain-containing response regulator [Pseudomonas sp. BN102]